MKIHKGLLFNIKSHESPKIISLIHMQNIISNYFGIQIISFWLFLTKYLFGYY